MSVNVEDLWIVSCQCLKEIAHDSLWMTLTANYLRCRECHQHGYRRRGIWWFRWGPCRCRRARPDRRSKCCIYPLVGGQECPSSADRIRGTSLDLLRFEVQQWGCGTRFRRRANLHNFWIAISSWFAFCTEPGGRLVGSDWICSAAGFRGSIRCQIDSNPMNLSGMLPTPMHKLVVKRACLEFVWQVRDSR